jgi:phosphopentomutase
VNLGIRETLADMGQTIAENYGATIPHGASFLHAATEPRGNAVAKRGTIS